MAHGIKVNLRGADYTLAPLSLFQMKEGRGADLAIVRDAINERDDAKVFSEESIEALARVAQASMKMSHPEITVEDVERLIDMGSFLAVYAAVRGISLPQKKADEPGETKAANE